MNSFGWKRVIGQKVSREKSSIFEKESTDDVDKSIESGDVDWITLAPKRTCIQLEDSLAKSARLQLEGVILAESERYWEALRKWEEALHFTPDNEKLYEMKAQAYLQLNEGYPALQAAEKSVKLNPLWCTALQTLGRAHLGMGEVRHALKWFSKAKHIDPCDDEVQEDFQWTLSVLEKKKKIEAEKLAEIEKMENVKSEQVVELDEEGYCISKVPESTSNDSNSADSSVSSKQIAVLDLKGTIHSAGKAFDNPSATENSLKSMPSNYVFMRD